MSNVLNRTTKEYLLSANEPDYPQVDWIWDPDVSAVAGFAAKYWLITGDVVSLMSQSARDAIDAQELSDRKDGIAERIQRAISYEKAFAEIVLDELNKHSLRFNSVLDAIDSANNLSSLKSDVALINDLAPRTLAQLKAALRGKL